MKNMNLTKKSQFPKKAKTL